jgi:hypothetical protein
MSSKATGQEALLIWCKNKAARYGITINDFTSSWSDGLALCALIHWHCPSLLDWKSIEDSLPYQRTSLASMAAEIIGNSSERWVIHPVYYYFY